ncbi:MAG: glycosyltransferase [Gemmatimonadaceae bacterium]
MPRQLPVHEALHDRLSVLHVLAPAAVGGLESVVRLVAAGQRRRGHDVLVAPLVTDVGARAAWIESVRSAGVVVEPIVVPRRRYGAEWRAVSEIIASRRPSVVHTHGYHADVVAGLAARRLGVPTVATVHGFIGGNWKNRFYEWLQCRVLRRFDAVIAVSHPMAERLERVGVDARRVRVVVNAFDAEGRALLPRVEARRELGLQYDAFYVGWVGRLSREKGLDVMVRALADARAVNVRLAVLGEGAERRRLEALARRLGVGERVLWLGIHPNAARLASAFDVIVISSRTEGTPIVLFEAMAACTPVVATRVGGVPDVVSPNEAVLVPAEDPGALARAIDAIRRDPDAAATRAAAARRRLARDFAPERWVADIERVYTDAIRSRQSARKP